MRFDELPDRWVIRFRDGVKDKDAAKILKEHGRKATRKCHVAQGKQKRGRGYKFELRNITEQQADKLRKRGEIILVEKSVRCVLFSTIPNDTRWSEQWALNPSATVGGAPVTGHAYGPTGWDYDTGGSIIVAVVDTGVDYTHPDLAANMWDDGYGHIGHSFTPSGESNDGAPPVGPDGVQYHGTHVAGIIGAVGNNAAGIAGVCWTCKIMPIQVFYWYYDSWGNVNWTLDTVDAADAVEWAVDHGAKVINHSWGGGGNSPLHLVEAWEYAADNDVTCVCASGNYGLPNDIWTMKPSDIKTENNIVVNSNTHANEMSFFTDYGIASTHIFAPGGNAYGSTDEQNILSTVPDGKYAKLAGTSMACPHITGAIALARTYYDPVNGHLPNSWVRRLLAGCIRPAEDYFMTSAYGGRLDLERLLYHITTGQGIHLESVSDISIQPDLDDPSKSVLTWTNPSMAGFVQVYISRQEGSFPPDRLGDVMIYSGTDETCEDTGVEAGVIYGYKFETVYNLSGIKFAIPIYVRHLAGWAPFVCPVAPANFEFICDYWDETWYPIEGVPLFECHNLAQLWRAVTSKNMTAEVNQIAGLPFTFRPGALFRHYEVVDTYPFPTVPVDPQPTHCGKHEIIKHGAIFIEDLVKNVQFLLGGFTLTSRKWPERGLMLYRWLDYYYYVTTGKVKAWTPGDSNILNWTSEDCKDREKWQEILSDCRHALHNMRVLFTGIPPWNTFFTELILDTDDSLPATIDGETHTTEDYDIPWSAGVEYHADPELEATAPVPIEIGPLGIFRWMALWVQSVAGGVWAMVDQHIPRYHLERESWTCHLYRYEKAMFADWEDVSSLEDEFEPDYDSPTYGTASQVQFADVPKFGVEVPVGWTWDDMQTLMKGPLAPASYAKTQRRTIIITNGILQCGQNWDWENEPVVFDVWLLIQAIESFNVASEWSLQSPPAGESYNAIPDIFPDDDECGYVEITVYLPEIMGGGSVSYQFNPTQLYHQGGMQIKLGSFVVDDPNDLRHEFRQEVEMPHDTLPAYNLCRVDERERTVYTDWWGEAWSGQENLHDWSLDIEAPEPVAHKLVNRYCVMRCGGVLSRIQLTSHWPVPAQKQCPYVPDLRGMHITDDFTAMEDVAEKVGLDVSAALDDSTEYQEHYEVNSTFRVINQVPVQGMLAYTGNPNAPSIGPNTIKYTVSAYEGDTETTVIPKVVGLTVEEAEAYLAANFPDWSIDSGEWVQEETGTDPVTGDPVYTDVWHSHLTYQLCNHRYPGQITGQNPDWRIRQPRFRVGGGNVLSVSVSAGFTQGAAMCKGFVGRNIADADVQADIQALYDYDPATPISTTYQILLDSDRPTGTIMAQSPPKYSVFPRKNPGNLKLLVAVKWDEETPKQTPPYDWPDLRGMTLAEAQAECAGKYTVSTHGRVYSQRAAGLIVSQSPRPIYKTAFSPEVIYVCISAGLFNCDDLLRCETKP